MIVDLRGILEAWRGKGNLIQSLRKVKQLGLLRDLDENRLYLGFLPDSEDTSSEEGNEGEGSGQQTRIKFTGQETTATK